MFETPRECALLNENQKLKDQIRRLEWELKARGELPVIDEDDPGAVRLNVVDTETVSRVAGWRVYKDGRGSIKVIGTGMPINSPGMKGVFHYSYFVSEAEILSSDIPQLLGRLHTEVVRKLAQEYKK